MAGAQSAPSAKSRLPEIQRVSAKAGAFGIPGRRACQSEPLASERTSASEALRTGDDGRARPTANAGAA
jgi:hypothetical protein